MHSAESRIRTRYPHSTSRPAPNASGPLWTSFSNSSFANAGLMPIRAGRKLWQPAEKNGAGFNSERRCAISRRMLQEYWRRTDGSSPHQRNNLQHGVSHIARGEVERPTRQSEASHHVPPNRYARAVGSSATGKGEVWRSTMTAG